MICSNKLKYICDTDSILREPKSSEAGYQFAWRKQMDDVSIAVSLSIAVLPSISVSLSIGVWLSELHDHPLTNDHPLVYAVCEQHPLKIPKWNYDFS